MTAASVHITFKSVVVAKLVYAASSWWGFATTDDPNDYKLSFAVASVLAFVNCTTKLSKI